MTTPLISVILPVYNAELYLKDAIDSILGQSLTDFEFIIIDDASSDNSIDIIKSYSDTRIVFLQKPINTGYTDSLNMAIDISKGEYIARMDADDISLKERFRKQFDYMDSNPDVLVLGTRYKVIGRDETSVTLPIIFPEVKLFSLTYSPIAHPTAFIRRNVFGKYGLRYNKKMEPAEDYDLWTRILDFGQIENLTEVLLHYRKHQGQISNKKESIQIEAANQIRRKQLAKLMSFNDKSYDIDFALKIILKRSWDVSSYDLVRIDTLIQDLWFANKDKSLYNEKLFQGFLRNIWVYYLYKVRLYNPKGLYKILKDPLEIKSMGLLFTSKFIMKSLFSWKE
jgi:glycosyltransferase involved in cell wall biosynthesis